MKCPWDTYVNMNIQAVTEVVPSWIFWQPSIQFSKSFFFLNTEIYTQILNTKTFLSNAGGLRYCHSPNSTSTQLKSWVWHENNLNPPPPPTTTTHTNSMSAISQLLLTRFQPNFKVRFLGWTTTTTTTAITTTTTTLITTITTTMSTTSHLLMTCF